MSDILTGFNMQGNDPIDDRVVSKRKLETLTEYLERVPLQKRYLGLEFFALDTKGGVRKYVFRTSLLVPTIIDVEDKLEEHTSNHEIHKTSEEIRSEIVEEDIPDSIARLRDVIRMFLQLVDGASEEYNTLKKIQTKIEFVLSRLLGDNHDTILDTLEEALKWLNEYKDFVEAIPLNYIAKIDIADDLTTNNSDKVLSAKQGVVLRNTLITYFNASMTTIENEINRAIKREDEIDNKLSEEIIRSSTIDIDHEELIRANSDGLSNNNQRLTNEINRSTSRDNQLELDLTTEISRSTLEDFQLRNSLNYEIKDRIAGDDELNKRLLQEVADRTEEDNIITARIDKLIIDQGATDKIQDDRLVLLEKDTHVQNTDVGTTSNTFQLKYKTGNKIKDDGSGISIRNSADNAYADIFAQNAVFKGNLTVEGTSTVINTETVEVKDNILVLNNGETGPGVTKGMAGISIDRGTQTPFSFIFDESDQRFKVGIETDMWPVALRDNEINLSDKQITYWDAPTKRLKTNTYFNRQFLTVGDIANINTANDVTIKFNIFNPITNSSSTISRIFTGATGSIAGLMTSIDKTYLDRISSKTVLTSLEEPRIAVDGIFINATNYAISTNGVGSISKKIPLATSSLSGLLSPTEKIYIGRLEGKSFLTSILDPVIGVDKISLKLSSYLLEDNISSTITKDLPLVTTTLAGLISPADKIKLNTITTNGPFIRVLGDTMTGTLILKQVGDVKLVFQSEDADNFNLIASSNSAGTILSKFGYHGTYWGIDSNKIATEPWVNSQITTAGNNYLPVVNPITKGNLGIRTEFTPENPTGFRIFGAATENYIQSCGSIYGTAGKEAFPLYITGFGNRNLPKIELNSDFTNVNGKLNISNITKHSKGSMTVGDTSTIYNNVASYYSTKQSNTGILKITLPVGWSSTMLSFEIDLYCYTNYSNSKYIVSGYNYVSIPAWGNTGVTLIGTNRGRVRLGYDGSKCCILIGDVDTVWPYTGVYVTKVTAHYGSSSLSDVFATGYDISFLTSEVGLINVVQTTINGAGITTPTIDTNKVYIGEGKIYGIGMGYTANSAIFDTIESGSDADYLELCYGKGAGVKVGPTGNKPLYAGTLYQEGALCATRNWSNTQYSPLSVFTKESDYAAIHSGGNELCVTGTNASMFVNFRTPSGKLVPNTWDWRVGTSTSHANHIMGGLINYGNVVINPIAAGGNGYYQGIRVNKGPDDWALVYIGGRTGSINGVESSGWTVGSNASDNLIIAHRGSSDTAGLMLYNNGSRPRWKSNELAYLSDASNKLPLAGGTLSNYLYLTRSGVTTRLGSENNIYMHYDTNASSGHWFNKTVFVQGDIYGGTSNTRRLAYADELISGSNYVAKTGDTMTGMLTVNGGVCLNRVANSGNLKFYNTSYVTWIDYMSPSGAGLAPSGGATTGYGTVTGWARRSVIENSTGYGWVWEKAINGPNINPTPVMSLGINGQLTVNGDIYSDTKLMATQEWVTGRGYITSAPNNYVTSVTSGNQGSLTINRSGLSSVSTVLRSIGGFYTSQGLEKPNAFGSGLYLQMLGSTNTGITGYVDTLIMNSYISDVPNCNALMFMKDGSARGFIVAQNPNNATWGNKYEIITTGNIRANIPAQTWASITGKPTTLSGYGITDGVTTSDARLTNARPASDVYAWAKTSTKPAYSASEVRALAVGGTAVNSVKWDSYTVKVATSVPQGLPAGTILFVVDA